MCGIAGILNLGNEGPPEEHLMRGMLGAIRHRGPDEFGIYLSPRVALGNARLSIVDLSGGQQPICNEDRRFWIVFNGEIFNHVELRAELEARGHSFATRCDTEVIVHLYEDEGSDCLRRLNGQFAMALWDSRERTLFLARDRLGVRPLFYTRFGSRLIFGSEIKALMVVPGVQATLDPIAIEDILTYWSPQGSRTCFDGVREVPPGHYLCIRDELGPPQTYWHPQFNPPDRSKEVPFAESMEALNDLLVDATKLRLRADVPVGAYLSGGLDSSLIAAMVRGLGVSRLDTFSISFSDPRFDESPFQKRMAKFLGTDHQVVDATPADIGQALPEVIWHTETPLVRTSPVPLFLLSRLVRERGYKVVLTGEGADEFLAGYDVFKEAKIRRFWSRQPGSKWRPSLLRRLYPDIQALSSTGSSYLRAFFGVGLQDLDDPAYSHAIRWRNSRRNLRFLSPELREQLTVRRRDTSPSLPPGFENWDVLQRAQHFEITTFLSPYLLASQGDRVAMAHSVEGRFPFLDHRVVNFCNALPSRHKLRGLTEKHILRKLAARWLPPEIEQRPKRPYRAPIHRSFMNGSATPDYVRELLSPEALGATGIFFPPAVAQLVAKLQASDVASETDEMGLLGILSTQVWHHLFLTAPRAPRPLDDGDNLKIIRDSVSPGV
jgi:asparagine synthase (glutamine-hydrolysing)